MDQEKIRYLAEQLAALGLNDIKKTKKLSIQIGTLSRDSLIKLVLRLTCIAILRGREGRNFRESIETDRLAA